MSTGVDSMVVRFGRPIPWRGIIASLILGVVGTVIGTVLALLSAHPENAPLLLLFLLIPAVTSPLLIVLNQYAVFDPQTGLISINAAAPVPLSHITHARTAIFRGVSTLDLGTGPSRAERFIVANGPFGSPPGRTRRGAPSAPVHGAATPEAHAPRSVQYEAPPGGDPRGGHGLRPRMAHVIGGES